MWPMISEQQFAYSRCSESSSWTLDLKRGRHCVTAQPVTFRSNFCHSAISRTLSWLMSQMCVQYSHYSSTLPCTWDWIQMRPVWQPWLCPVSLETARQLFLVCGGALPAGMWNIHWKSCFLTVICIILCWKFIFLPNIIAVVQNLTKLLQKLQGASLY